MNSSVYVYGPAGCGKTTNADRFLKAYGLKRVIDDFRDGRGWDKAFDNLRARAETCGDLILGESREVNGLPSGVRVVSYADAMAFANRGA